VFQSLLGRLKTKLDGLQKRTTSQFQSLLGRLKTLFLDVCRRGLSYVSIPLR